MADLVGFLSVRYQPEHGFFGGYLIVNQLARPLEFHCTMPVRPSRSQELLYGSTSNDSVCGEQIAKALTQKAKLKPEILLTDTPAVLSLEVVSKLAVALVESGETSRNDLSVPPTNAELERFKAGSENLCIRKDSQHDKQHTIESLSNLGDRFDLLEPFQRVVDALLEAHPNVKAA